ncbi:hypothetical protein K6119_15465 [Paracrocinitomix mangrovi]|uniref:hypothetical protein n=1 Tax=Paracrocinitomix mangrovi TaxID=2862509 RepID=UPI001C8F0364|nr:hypothetical protein [Paracrocinitomix mangrovi]UKN01127.1 hypothetical protein K6119_15465 [Paracrocinitomix mangrovi]
MKKSFYLFILFIAFHFTGFTQVNDDISVVCMGYGKEAERTFWVRGQKAITFVDYLFEQEGKSKKGCKHKFKNVSIPGVEGSLTLKIHEGVHGRKKEGNCISSYFNTFENEKYKASRMSKMEEGEQIGIIIYVKKAGRNKHTTKTDRTALVNYIRKNCKD